MAFDTFIGNEALRKRLDKEMRASLFSHAYILEGPYGTGKHTLATLITAALNCENRTSAFPCLRCPACRKILDGASPDVRLINRGSKAGIGVDDIRFLRQDVLIPPNDTETKIYVIEEADTMTAQAQNALLLTLEEPPAYVLFLLLCENASSLLETVRSRAPRLRLHTVNDAAIDSYLADRTPTYRALSGEERATVLCMAHGSIGKALDLCDEAVREPLEARRRMASEYCTRRFRRPDAAAMLALCASFGKTRKEVLDVLDDISTALRDLLLLKQTENAPLLFYTDREAALALADSVSPARILSVYDQVEANRRRLLANANVRLITTALSLLTT